MDKEDVLHIYSRISLRPKKNETMPFTATWMVERIILR